MNTVSLMESVKHKIQIKTRRCSMIWIKNKIEAAQPRFEKSTSATLSERAMALGSTQPLREMSTRYFFWGGGEAAGSYGWRYHLYVSIV